MGDIINFLFDRLHEILGLSEFAISGDYKHGFLVGIGLALVVGWLSRMFLFHRGRILYFFATIPPSLRPSPSGFQSMMGCSRSGCVLLILAIGLLFTLSGSLYACTH